MSRDDRLSARVRGAALAILLCVPVGVRAQDPPAQAPGSELHRAASAHFQRGVVLYQEGAYRAALIELKRANEISPDYHVLYNIGQTHYALAEYVEAIQALALYLAQGGAEITPARRDDVESTLVELKGRVASLRITVDRDGAVISVDGVEVGEAPLSAPLSISLGRHRVSARTADGALASDSVDVAGGDQITLTLVLLAAPVPRPPVQSRPGVAAKPATTFLGSLSRRDRWGYGLLASATALTVGGSVLAVMAKNADSAHEAALRARPGSSAAIASARDDLERNARIADVLFGTALAAGVTGLVLVLLREDETRAFQVGLGPSSLVATGRF